MTVVFTVPDVSLDWQALAKVIAVTPTLPPELTLEVGKDCARVLDEEGKVIEPPLPERYVAEASIATVGGKATLLAALDERFGTQRPPSTLESPSHIARPTPR